MSVIKHCHAKHYSSIFFHTNPLLFFVLPFTQAYIPLYGMPVAFAASRILSYSATTLPSRDICAIGKSRHTLPTIIVITFMKRLIIDSEDSKDIVIKKIKKLQKFIYKIRETTAWHSCANKGGVGINCKACNTRSKRTCRMYIVYFAFLHDGSGGQTRGIMGIRCHFYGMARRGRVLVWAA